VQIVELEQELNFLDDPLIIFWLVQSNLFYGVETPVHFMLGKEYTAGATLTKLLLLYEILLVSRVILIDGRCRVSRITDFQSFIPSLERISVIKLLVLLCILHNLQEWVSLISFYIEIRLLSSYSYHLLPGLACLLQHLPLLQPIPLEHLLLDLIEAFIGIGVVLLA